MNIESLLVTKNRDKFDKIISFMKSLIVKNEVEADNVETTDTASQYSLYEKAFLKRDMTSNYKLFYDDMVEFGFTEMNAKKYTQDPDLFQTQYMNGNELCKQYLNKLRSKRVKEYTENNKYYRQFCGLPYDDTQFINITNNDKVSEDEPDTIYLHEVNMDDYPKTYSRLYYERDIEKVYNDYNYMYLTFIENPMTPYDIRNKGQFEICYYDKSLLDDSELEYWFEVYNISKNEILLIDYIDAFQNSYGAYVNIMYMFILQYAFNLYCAKMLEKYAVRDYSDDEIYDILDSNGLSNLKKLDISLLRRVVKRLPDIQTYIGTDKVIDIIFDIVADDSLTVKRYYLNKKYNVDNEGNTTISNEELYNKSVDLVFVEKTVNRGSNVSSVMDTEYDYESIVMEDDTWGGTIGVTDNETKRSIKNAMKKELLAADFSSIITKYIGLTKVVNMHVKLVDANSKLGLFYQYSDLIGNKLSTDSVTFNDIETTPICIYAAWCITHGIINGLTDPDYIVSEMSTIEGIMKLRTTDKIKTDVLNLKNVEIDLGNGYNRTLGYYLTDSELEKYLVGFNFNSNTSIEDILENYEENYEIIKTIQKKIENSYDYAEYKVWETLLKANTTSVLIKDLFGNAKNYSEYIKENSKSFYNTFKVELDTANSMSKLKILNDNLYKVFLNYLMSISNNEIIYATSEDDVVGGENLIDVATLFNQFMSVYTQLFKQDYHVSYDDALDHTLALLYSKCTDVFKSEDKDVLQLVEQKVIDILKTVGLYDYLELLYYKIKDVLNVKQDVEIVLEDEIVSEIFKYVRSEYFILDYIKILDAIKSKDSMSLSLIDEIIEDKIIDK